MQNIRLVKKIARFRKSFSPSLSFRPSLRAAAPRPSTALSSSSHLLLNGSSSYHGIILSRSSNSVGSLKIIFEKRAKRVRGWIPLPAISKRA